MLEIRRLWAEDIAPPRPVQDPLPLWLGVMGPRGARMAGRLGAGLLWLGDDLVAPYEEGLREGGHDRATGRRAGLLNLILADDPEAAYPRIAPFIEYQRGSYSRYGAEGRSDGSTGASTVSAGPIDVGALRERRHPPISPRFDVVTPQEAIARARPWLEGKPIEDIFLWASIAGMPDEIADRHAELVAKVVAPGPRRRRDTAPERRSHPVGTPPHGARLRRGRVAEDVVVNLAGMGDETRIGLLETDQQPGERQVGVGAACADVLHVPAAVAAERVQQRVGGAVEVQCGHAEAGAQRGVERGCGLAPHVADVQLAVAVEHEQIGPHDGGQALGLQVVAHVGEPEPRRDAERARRGRRARPPWACGRRPRAR